VSEPVKVELLGLGLTMRGTVVEGFHARGVYRNGGVTLALHGLVEAAAAEIEDLLRQIEQQYGDFSREVAWRTADGRIDIGWQLDDRGHLRGRLRLDDPGRWRFETALEADQSYLPKMALGLRLLLRG